MAYGRLDVFWPDGNFKSYPLIENTVSVGRSTGNTIALDTNTISRYHFSIRTDGEQVILTDLDSINGTFVDGERVETHRPRILDGGEEIQAGHLRIIYHHLDEMPTQPMTTILETTQRLELASPAFRIDVIPPEGSFPPGAHKSAELSITNTGEQRANYRIEASGMPSDWIRISRPELEIEPGETELVLVNFKPLRRPESRPGDYAVVLRVIHEETSGLLEANLLIRVLSYSGFGMALEPKRINSGERFKLHLHNQGSAILPLTLSGQDRAGRLSFTIQPPQVSLGPGQRMTVSGEVRAKSPAWFGKPIARDFDLRVRSNDAARFTVAARGHFIERPLLPGWAPLAALAAVIMIGLCGLLLAGVIFAPRPEPNISAFSVNSPQVAQGQAIALNWAATNAQQFDVQVNGTPVLSDLSPDTTSVSLDTRDLAGPVQISLVASNGGQSVSAAQSVVVYVPLGEGSFTADPPQLVRYVVQSLSVAWDVPGAVRTRITGLERFSTTQIDSTYGASGSIRGLVGIANEALSLILLAEDQVGNIVQTALQIPVVNPQCRPGGNGITLYAGPDTRQQVVGTIARNTAVVVDAQDSSGLWIRAQLPGGLRGWGPVDAFACDPIFQVSDLYKELVVPTLPPPTPTLNFITLTPRVVSTPAAPVTPTTTPTTSG
ncbi:MAG TPA: FHA domain-containing protein [Aggregatilineales bacterium]|nr:FHA domain-containing protein [Aggregatilineales bacterium]